MILSNNSRVLVIGAHPDDYEFAMGGTILRHKSEGDVVYGVILACDNVTTGMFGLRKRKESLLEARSAAKLLGLDKLIFLNHKHHFVSFDGRVVESIDRIIRSFDPDIVYVPYIFDSDQDHHSGSKSAIAASRYVRNIIMYEPTSVGGSFVGFSPNYYIDITNFIEKKLEVIGCHKSQLVELPHSRNIESVKCWNRFRGSAVGFMYAEAFMVYRGTR